MGKYHFIAIGGIGMSGLAKYLLQEGHRVTGSDLEDSKYLTPLKELGAKVYIGHSEDNLPDDTDAVIVSTAVKQNNPELSKAKRLGIKIFHRSDLLQEISKNAQSEGKIFIGFSGTHGKTTTSGLTSYVLQKSGLNPSFVVGGIVPDLHTNSQHNKGKFFVAELDESDGTIVKYNPDILVINNLEEDHVDYYKNGLEDLVKTFNKAVENSKKVIINADNYGTSLLKGDFITFGIEKDADYRAKKINYTKDNITFDVYHNGSFLNSVKIILSGVHNVYNTLAVIAALNECGETTECLKDAFEEFTGMGRRFEKVCEINGAAVYDDYAHHPTEIKAALNAAAQKFGKENIIAVFQPHRYTRLQGLWDEFKTSFDDSAHVVVTDVYEASEDPIEGVTGKNFAAEIGAKHLGGSIEDVAKSLLPLIKKGNVVIGLGAGTITNLGKYLKKMAGELSCK